MDVRQLKYFLAVAEEEQITRAAKRLNMAQPPLSQQIKQLETELGVQLIKRGGNRKISLTEAGHLLRNRAEQILELIERTAIEIREMSDNLKGILAIGFTTAWDTTFLPDQISSFHALYPEINFQLWDGDSYRIEELLNSGVIEVGITKFCSDTETFTSILLPDEPIVAAFGSGGERTPLTGCIRLADLVNQSLIVHRQYEKTLLEYFRAIRMEPKIRCRHVDNRSMLAWAGTGLGVAIVPRSAVSLVPGNTMILREIIEPPLRTSATCIVWMRNRPLSAAAQLFIEMFAKTKTDQ